MPRSPSHRSQRDTSPSPDRYRDRTERKKRSKHRSRSPEERSRRKEKKHKRSRKERHHSSDEDEGATCSRQSLDALGYSNINNPYNDINLESKFVWEKKKESDRKRSDHSKSSLRQSDRERREQTDKELAKIRQRREEFEIERELREEEKMRKQREAELAQAGDLEKKEEEFHFEQAKQRAKVRIKEGRAKPIDLLVMNLCAAYEPDKLEGEIDLGIDVDEPYTIFANMGLEDTEEFCEQADMHIKHETIEKARQFWQSLRYIAEDHLDKLQNARRRAEAGSVAPDINKDVERIISNKTVEQLTKLSQQISAKFQANKPMDVEYWENLQREVNVQIERVRLDGMHQETLKIRLERLRDMQREEGERAQEELARMLSIQGDDASDGAQPSSQHHHTNTESYNRSMSPEPVPELELEDRELPIIDPQEDLRQLMALRREVLSSKIIPMKTNTLQESVEEEPQLESATAVALYQQEEAKGFNEDEGEEMFNIEAEISKEVYTWQDKYRPRKPRYFNRVHTGYEWNKYNQTHYDHDNPPPKVVQGYKFNIFYPDLIDKSAAPTYHISKEPGSPETVLIRFTAGPPYEDIAFRIVNREWEYSHKKGFRSTFDRGVLSLWFHFKRQFYRK